MIEEKKILEKEIQECTAKKVERVGTTRRFVLNHQEKRIIQDGITTMNNEKKVLTDSIKQKRDTTAYLKYWTAEYKAIMENECKDNGRTTKTSTMRQKIERSL